MSRAGLDFIDGVALGIFAGSVLALGAAPGHQGSAVAFLAVLAASVLWMFWRVVLALRARVFGWIASRGGAQ